MSISWIDQIIVVVYLLAMASIGFIFARRNKGTEEYFTGGRSHGGLLLGLSLVGASISSVTFIAHPADAFKTAWLRFIPALTLPLAIIFAGYFFVPLYRRARVTSAYEYLESRFGQGVRVYAAMMFTISQLIRLSLVLYLLSVVVKTITGLDENACIIIAGAVTALYTITGGLNAVIWTDAIQTVVLIGGGLVILLVAIGSIPGGLGEVIHVATEQGKLSAGDLDPATGKLVETAWLTGLAHKSIIMMLIVGLTGWLTEYVTNQGVVQRYVAAKSAAEARRSIWICTVMSIPIWGTFMFMGTVFYVYYVHFPDENVAQMLSGARKAEDILPYFLTTKVPIGIVGLVVAGIMAAAMSTLSSCMNACASVATVDIYQRQFVRGRSDKHYLWAGWFFTGVAAVVMVIGALVLLHANTKTMNDFMAIVTAIVSAGILAVFLLGFLTKRASVVSVSLGIVAAIIFSLWCVASGRAWMPEALRFTFDLYYAAIIGNLLLFGIGYFGGFVFPPRHPIAPNLTIWDRLPFDDEEQRTDEMPRGVTGEAAQS